MSSTPRKSAQLFVEPLEARIAPTGLVAITNPDPNNPTGRGDPNFITYNSGTSVGGLHFQPGSDYGVAGNGVYAIKLTGNGTLDPNTNLNTGDKLLIYNSVTGFNANNPFLQAANGSIVAFFHDANNDGQVQNNELVGIAAGKNASLNVNGSVNGPIIDNLKTNGALKLTGGQKTKFTIGNLNVTGDVTGDILAGGSIGSFTIVGNVHGILAGTGAGQDGFAYTLAGDPAVTTGVFRGKVPADGVAGSSIGTAGLVSSVGSIGNPAVPGDGVFHTGDGGRNAPGGSITGLTVQNDTNGFALFTGNGGNGDINAPAGPGGSVVNFLVRGVFDSTPLSAAKVISVTTGVGGVNGDTKGAAGGAINGVAIGFDPGFDFVNNSGSASVDHLNDIVILHSGDGGIGKKGGKGGAVTLVNVVTATPDGGNGDTSETQILSGAGGASSKTDADGVANGVGGRGGDINTVLAQNLLLPANDPANPANNVVPGSILVQAGNGGAAKPGGNVGGVTLLGQHLTVNAGNGLDGSNHGGAGGSVNGVAIENLANLFATRVSINAGTGGTGTGGFGGAGGTVDTVTITDSRLDPGGLTISAGNGGNGNGATGGAGGTVNNVNVTDTSDAPINAANGIIAAAPASPVLIRTGNGGTGTTGNNGGTLTNVTVLGTNIAFAVTTGSGGTGTDGNGGTGGAGGAIVGLNLSNQPVEVFNLTTTAPDPITGVPITTVTTRTIVYNGNTATVASGNGGDSNSGIAGAGGDITQLNVITNVNTTPQPDLSNIPAVPDNYTVTSGNGGAGATLAGKGGDMTSPLVQSIFGSVSLHAGNGGGNGDTGGSGGTINGAVLRGLGTLSIIAGDGGAGGAGGSITNSGTTLTSTSSPDFFGNNVVFATNNIGDLTVRAGNGSAGASAGAGGSVTNFSGYVSAGGVTSITAGNGGGATKLTGAGGSVSTIKLTGVGDGFSSGSIVTIDAGDAGITNKAKNGSNGGDATGIDIFNLDFGTVVHHVAAGDGSFGKKTGGNGGTVNQVSVGLANEAVAIGYLTGHNFGYDLNQDLAGGVFAGAAGGSNQAAGTSGNVTNVTAAAIASIVAGKTGDLAGRLATTVDNIYLVGSQKPAANGDGSFASFDTFDTANVLGSVATPTDAGASTFKPNVDGLLAALNITANRNFIPEATLTRDANGVLTLVDLIDFDRSTVSTPNPAL